ncbi:biotinidase [Trichonephila inaurata madagascariensis]|uniref:Biotinidase n=1 Tax=Trichonephila inaurata madagascariensis TaxID=2747483 RepID=A0A8X6Y4X7_9ARAC|nr:biotinidase [Trichonephila inaurata madagascariensis]
MVDISLSVDENSYRAAVFEIVQFQIEDSSYSGEDVINKNLEKYDKAAKVAAENDVDLIVFPEEGLYSTDLDDPTWFINYGEDIPDPRTESANPCDQEEYENRPVLRNLSCIAKNYGLYVVADEIDVKKCEIKNSCDEYNADYCVTNGNSCPGGGNFNFNTGLVFDGKGNLIVRYYKRYLFFEEDINVPKIFRNTYFETDFGNFTIDINFDTMFYDSVKGIEKSGVTSLVFPTYWFDYTPLVFFAIPLQQAWSITYKVNIIAANVHEPRTGSVGSGIYSPDRGVLVYTDNPDGRSKLLISNVPKSPTDDLRNIEPPNTKFFYLDDDEVTELQEEEPRNFQKECGLNVLGALPEDLTDYRCQLTSVRGYEFRKLEGTSGSFGLCSKAFCCSLTYESESMNENYYFGVSSMPLTFQDSYVLGTEACFLARCEPFDGRPCGNFILKSDTVFLFAEMRATFTTKYIYPYAINSDIRLTDKEEWEFDGNSHMFYQNIKNDSLLFLGLYGRKFDEDKILN